MEVPTIRLYKGREDIVCNVERRKHFESLGWKEKPDKKAAENQEEEKQDK